VVAQAQSVSVVDGNILLTNRLGEIRTLTRSGRDSQPAISPDGKAIVFVRSTGKTIQGNVGDEEATELWLIGSDGLSSERLVSGREDTNPKKNLAVLSSPQFSPDGTKIYFLSTAWVTSDAVHVVDIESKVESFVCDGNTIDVIRAGKYRGFLVVQKHKYYSGERGGSYDHYWLVSPKGVDVRQIGEEEDYQRFKTRTVSRHSE